MRTSVYRCRVFLIPVLFGANAVHAQYSPSTSPPPPAKITLRHLPDSATDPLDIWLTSDTLWKTTPREFPPNPAWDFRWVSSTLDAARADKPGLCVGDLPVVEVIARFAPGDAAIPTSSPGIAAPPAAAAATGGRLQLSGIQISIYNRGDAGDLDQKTFEALVGHSKAAIDKLTDARAIDRGADNTSAVPSRGLVWMTPSSVYLLEWSATPENRVQGVAYRAEFVRLKITPRRSQPKNILEQLRADSAPPVAATRAATVRAADLPARVVHDPFGGERLPDIPMVDQGQKGYCVTAATERVLRYYGVEVDENELAQVANTATSGGTSTEAMIAALRKLASRFKVNVVTEVHPTYQDFIQEIDDYNRVARNAPKELGAKLIDAHTNELDLGVVFEQMNGELLRDARTKLNPANMTHFEHEIQARLDRGIPLLWSVELGLLPEEKLNPQSRGGHMRLIIGYNAKNKQVFYSDTWGAGHELKTMPLANAWTITTGLFTLEPI